MAVPFLNSITLNKNEVQDFKVYNIGTGNPTLSSGGDIGYFWTDTTGSASARVLKWWDGSNVRTVLDSSSTTVIAADLSGGAAGSLPYQQGASDTTFLGIGTAGQVLKVNSGATAPEWTAQSNLSVGTATFLAGGTAGDIPVQSAAGTTGFLNIGANGRILTSNGTTPVWSATIPSSAVSGLAASATTDTTNASNISSGTLSLGRLSLANGQFYVGDASNNPAATAKTSIPLSGFGAAGADVAMGGFKITGLADPVDATDAANRKYVDEVAQGLDVKASCLVGTIANINLSAPGSSIDGISLSSSNRVLVKDQTDKKQNGIYVWNGAAVAMTRSLDADTVAKLVGAFTFVEQGTNADSGWVCQVDSGTIGSVDIEWVKFSQAGSYTAGNGMVLSGGVFHFAKSTAYTEGQIPFCSNTPTANRIGFSSNLFWDNSNSRLGIGTATPNATVSIKQTGAQIDVSTSATDVTFEAIDRAATTNAINTRWYTRNGEFQWNNSSYSRAMTLDSSGNLGLAVTPAAWSGFKALQIARGSLTSFGADTFLSHNWYWSGTADTYIANDYATRYYQSQGKHIWDNGGTSAGTAGATISFATKMTLDASGRLGIGTATVDGKVHIYGDTYANSQLRIQRNGAVNGTFSIGIAGTNNTLYIQDEVNATARLIIDGSGNLGLGVTPSAWGSSYKAIQMGQVGSINYKNFIIAIGGNYYNNGTNDVTLINGYRSKYEQDLSNGTHIWYQAGIGTGNVSWNQSMTLDASGNLGVGTTSPASRFHTYLSDAGTNDFVRIATLQRATTGTAAVGFGQYLRFDLERSDGSNEISGFIGTKWSNATAGVTKGDLVFGGSDNGALTTAMTLNAAGSLLFSTNGTASAPTIANADDTNTGLYWPTDADTLALAVGGSDAVYIDAGRKVGIGTSTPTGKLHVVHTAGQAAALLQGGHLEFYKDATPTAAASIGLGGPASGSTNDIVFNTYGGTWAERLRIKSTGQLNFSGLASAPTGAVGDLYYNSTSNTLQYHNNSAFQQISRKVSAAGAGTGTTITVTHNFGTKDVIVQVRDSSDAQVLTDVSYATNSVTVTFASSQTLSNYTVTVIG